MPKLSEAAKNIKEDYSKIKDKEIKLEGDLAIAEFSKLETQIAELALKVCAYQKIIQVVKSLEHPDKDKVTKFNALQKQLEYHEHKISVLKDCISDMIKTDDKVESVFFKQSTKQFIAAADVKECIERNSTLFSECGFTPAEAFNLIKTNLK